MQLLSAPTETVIVLLSHDSTNIHGTFFFSKKNKKRDLKQNNL